ncbi:MAG TPA: rhodanese-like domain-containing protein [Nitrososphaera sp.]|jgi:rhodanese-related sulfurtransferase|nr:rhodanese-like domain-containing protein [Nitrososphaera sp.]
MADKITVKDLAERKNDFVLIDVREADEVETDGMIEEATNIPLGQLIRNARQGALNNLKGKEIVTYCNGGYRGNIGADELVKKGFKARTIEGGYEAWEKTAPI